MKSKAERILSELAAFMQKNDYALYTELLSFKMAIIIMWMRNYWLILPKYTKISLNFSFLDCLLKKTLDCHRFCFNKNQKIKNNEEYLNEPKKR